MVNETTKYKKFLYIDGKECFFDEQKPLIRIAEENGIFIPRFCEHPDLDPVALCRQCLVEINGEKKLATACSTYPKEGMEIHTQYSSRKAKDGQEFMLELLLTNHPLDCPMCDKGGECPLQNQAFKNGNSTSHFQSKDKRVFKKPISLSQTILLDRERCVNCARCTRFSSHIAGDPQIVLSKRGAQQQVSIARGQDFISYFSVNTVQICPVGALTTSHYRFQSRPFDLVSTKTSCEHCSFGCSLRVDARSGKITRVLAYRDDQVNGEWACNKGFLVYENINQAKEAFRKPIIRENNEIKELTYYSALNMASKILSEGKTAILMAGRLTASSYEASIKLANAIQTPLIDFRIRQYKKEETQFLNAYREQILLKDKAVKYSDFYRYDRIILVAIDIEEEVPLLLLKLKALKKNKAKVVINYIGKYLPRCLKKIEVDSYIISDDLAASLKNYRNNEQEKILVIVGENFSHLSESIPILTKAIEKQSFDILWAPRRSGELVALKYKAFSERFDLKAILNLISLGKVENLLCVGLDIDDLPYDHQILFKKIKSIIAFDYTQNSLIKQFAKIAIPVASNLEQEDFYINLEGRVRATRNVFDQDVALSSSSMERLTAVTLINKLIKRIEINENNDNAYSLLPDTFSRDQYLPTKKENLIAFQAVTFIPFWNRGLAQRLAKQTHNDYYRNKDGIVRVFISQSDLIKYNLVLDKSYTLIYYLENNSSIKIELPINLSLCEIVESNILIPLYHTVKVNYGSRVFIKLN